LGNWPISDSPRRITHGVATLLDAINISYLLGYKEVILAGVDLYDRNCFYLEKNETHELDIKTNNKASDPHKTSTHIIDTIKLWKPELKNKGITLKILNPQSLLNTVLEGHHV